MSGDLAALFRVELDYDDADAETVLLLSTEWTRDGRLARQVVFDEPDVEAAVRELENLGAAPVVLLDPSFAEVAEGLH